MIGVSMKIPLLIRLIPVLWLALGSGATAANCTLTVLGDSLSAGYGLDQAAAFPQQLEQALKRRGYAVRIINAGVSGDTTAGGLARLSWTLQEHPDLLILELGANDALRGLNPQQTRANLAAMLTQLEQAGIPTILAGMKAPRNLGEAYYSRFDRIYSELANEFSVPLYPFFLAGVAGHPELNQADGIHPNAAGVKVIVAGILPLVEATLTELDCSGS